MTKRRTLKNDTVRTSMTLPRDLKKRLEHAATDNDCDMQEIVIAALEKHLAKIERSSHAH